MIAKQRLADLIGPRDAQPAGAKLWLADRWPWTPGTEAAFSVRRPRWALVALEIEALDRSTVRDPEAFVRELNREHDPWPPDSKRPIREREKK